MKGILFALVMISPAAFAVGDYTNCANNSQTEVCQAYLAGLNQGKETVNSVAMTESERTFRTRALEQRVGERYRKTIESNKK
ncbi:hypothetical protein WAX88_00930 [Photobacterium damselae subsp. damselae]|uniref:Uncharacterized protein n=2 Tax=Photobacterium damselae TaxID=38293 RepID=A0A2T3QJY3_PHODM|nr:hypothetical protein [Photobacterium damselae]AWK82728.1 hypothetical protein BST98_12065 [Photobacterium damselae]EHA1081307.1 hypothetical protein [Photobacterium damselae]KAB1184735.1 hypothetical protein F6450_01645 [Photobacterium damselae subsp. damselae]MCG3816759.1 hypothetical protein [Photobacterium damselae]MDC4169033.1 hypothetical protein [Photobacterium damselae]